MVIALSHGGVVKDKDGRYTGGEDVRLASDVPGVDVVISGHSHTELKEPILVNGRTPVVQTGKESNNLGELVITLDGGWSTFWLGKNHNVVETDCCPGGSRQQWPLNKGIDRFYGFLGGETNNWYPDLVEDSRFIDAPYTPEEGYHLSKDLADHALQMIRDQKAGIPSRPW